MAKEINTIQDLPVGVTNEELKLLLQQNLALLQDTHDMTHKIKSYITFQKIMSFVYVFLIVAPIILSVFYLSPMLKAVMGQYGELLDINSPSSLIEKVNDLNTK